MRRLFTCTWIFLLIVVVCSCGKPKSFKINGELTDGSNTNLYVKYYADGAVNKGVTAAREGKFVAEFSASSPTLVEVLDNDNRVLGRLYVKNGDEVNIKIDRRNPFNNQVSGNDVNQRWSQVLNANADIYNGVDRGAINQLIDDYIGQNAQDIVGTLMFVSLYDASLDPVHADSILSLIAVESRPTELVAPYMLMLGQYVNSNAYAPVRPFKYRTIESDSMLNFTPGDSKVSLILITDEVTQRKDSIVPALKKLHKDYQKRSLGILDISCVNDTNTWKNKVKRDTATWTLAWVPAGIMGEALRPLAIPKVPYYFVVDSMGNQKYRGPWLGCAIDSVKSLLAK